MSRNIPAGWESYSAIGKRIEGTRFIAFKTPLDSEWYEQKESTEIDWLDCDKLIEQVPNLGLIIDLTNTKTRNYYRPMIFTRKGIRHLRIPLEGHRIPSRYILRGLKYDILDFLSENKDNDKLIGIHCTHGVNRTGYAICYYLITEMKLSADTALSRFEKARGHSINREPYIDDIYRMSSRMNFRKRHHSSSSSDSSSSISEDDTLPVKKARI